MTTLLIGGFLITYLATFHHEEAYIMTICEDEKPCVERYIKPERDEYGNWVVDHETR